MNVDDLILVSVDDHVIEPAHMFEGRVRAKYADKAPRFVRRDDGTMAWRLRRPGDTEHRPERGGRAPTGGVRLRAHLHRGDSDRLLRHRRPDQGHERQRRARVAELPVLSTVLRPTVHGDHRSRPGRGHGSGIQRLAYRGVGRHPPGPDHPAGAADAVGSGGQRRRGPPSSRQGLSRGDIHLQPI